MIKTMGLFQVFNGRKMELNKNTMTSYILTIFFLFWQLQTYSTVPLWRFTIIFDYLCLAKERNILFRLFGFISTLFLFSKCFRWGIYRNYYRSKDEDSKLNLVNYLQ